MVEESVETREKPVPAVGRWVNVGESTVKMLDADIERMTGTTDFRSEPRILLYDPATDKKALDTQAAHFKLLSSHHTHKANQDQRLLGLGILEGNADNGRRYIHFAIHKGTPEAAILDARNRVIDDVNEMIVGVGGTKLIPMPPTLKR